MYEEMKVLHLNGDSNAMNPWMSKIKMFKKRLNRYIQIEPNALNGKVDGSMPCLINPLRIRR